MSSYSFDKYLEPPNNPPFTPHSEESSGVPGEQVRSCRRRRNVCDVTELSPHLLEKQLLEEVAADERYALINEAKLRALKQGTNSYDQFRAIWMGAHLRPMAKEDKLDGFMNGPGSKVVWNAAAAVTVAAPAGGGGDSKEEEESAGSKEKPQPPHPTLLQRDIEALNLEPKSSLELWRCWRKLETQEGKLEYLKKLLQDSSNPLNMLWSEEIPSELFTQILRLGQPLIEGQGSREEVTTLRKVIDIAVSSKRISITTSFLENPEKELLSQMLQMTTQDAPPPSP